MPTLRLIVLASDARAVTLPLGNDRYMRGRSATRQVAAPHVTYNTFGHAVPLHHLGRIARTSDRRGRRRLSSGA